MYSTKILNVHTGTEIFSYRIHNIEGDYLVEPVYALFPFENNKHKKIKKDKRGKRKFPKIDFGVIRYSSLDEEKDKRVIELFLKYIPKKSDLEKLLEESNTDNIVIRI